MSPLPLKYNKKLSYMEPVYKNRFEIYFISNNLSKDECQTLTASSYKIEKNVIYIDVNEVDNGIPIYTILQKLENFDLEVNVINKMGFIIGKFIYTDCQFIKKLEHMISFDWVENNILEPGFPIQYRILEYIDSTQFRILDRRKKLKRIINI